MIINSKPDKCGGVIEIWSLDKLKKFDRLLRRVKNTMTYEGADGIAAVLSGAVAGSINAMYFGFDNSGSPATIATDANSKASDFRGLDGVDNDFVRVRLSAGVRVASSVNYSGNRITFTGIVADGDDGEVALSLTGGTSDITHMGLVIAPDWADNTQDFLYAAYTPAAVIPVPSGGGYGFRWQTTHTQS